MQTTLFDFWKPTRQPQPTNRTREVHAKECLEPLFSRSIPDDSRYTQRLQEEYELIDRFQFTAVFLQVKRILELIEELGTSSGRPIPHIIRGSAGSSLVCYLLGITHIDPIQYGIELARFMNRCRTDLPDIDIDVPYNRREEIYTRIASEWKGMVARISNHVKYTPKTALRIVAKEVVHSTFQPSKEKCTALKQLQKRNFKLDSIIPEKDLQEKIQQGAKKRVGTLKNYSKHCGGIVIFEKEGKVPEELLLRKNNQAL